MPQSTWHFLGEHKWRLCHNGCVQLAVAQVVAAGMLFGPEAGDVSIVVKLFRVALLLPVVLVISIFFVSQSACKVGIQSFKLIPLFLIGFIALSLVTSMQIVSPATVETISGISRWTLVVAIAAAGLKTNFQELVQLWAGGPSFCWW